MSTNIAEFCLDCGTPLDLTPQGEKKNHALNVGHIEEKENILIKLLL